MISVTQALSIIKQDYGPDEAVIEAAAERVCDCGCGQITHPAKYTDKSRGHIKGLPLRSCHGHFQRGVKGPAWKGGRRFDKDGYVLVADKTNRRATSDGYVREHLLIIEEVLGRPLKAKECSHHVNGIKKDNKNSNLVACQDQNYHMLLHLRARALKESGHASWRKCSLCHEYDCRENLYINNADTTHFHRSCHAEYERNRRVIDKRNSSTICY
jgi:hypothetical protein